MKKTILALSLASVFAVPAFAFGSDSLTPEFELKAQYHLIAANIADPELRVKVQSYAMWGDGETAHELVSTIAEQDNAKEIMADLDSFYVKAKPDGTALSFKNSILADAAKYQANSMGDDDFVMIDGERWTKKDLKTLETDSYSKGKDINNAIDSNSNIIDIANGKVIDNNVPNVNPITDKTVLQQSDVKRYIADSTFYTDKDGNVTISNGKDAYNVKENVDGTYTIDSHGDQTITIDPKTGKVNYFDAKSGEDSETTIEINDDTANWKPNNDVIVDDPSPAHVDVVTPITGDEEEAAKVIDETSRFIDKSVTESRIEADAYATKTDATLKDHGKRIGNLEQDMKAMGDKMLVLEDRMDGVVASSHAITNSRPVLSQAGQYGVGVGMGAAGSKQAIAIGGAYQISDNWSGTMSVNYETKGKVSNDQLSAGVGAQYIF